MFRNMLALCVVVCISVGQMHAHGNDSLASLKFAFGEQLLKKVIHMEHKMELMETALKQADTRMFNTLLNLTLEIENKTDVLDLVGEKVSIPLVAFNAYNAIDKSLETNQIMILQSTYINEGNGYDPVIGIFTAPAAGLYMFSVNSCNHAGNVFYFYIVVDNSVIARSTKYNTAVYDCAATTTLAKIQAGQRVWVKCASGSSSTTNLYESTYYQITFSGALLHG